MYLCPSCQITDPCHNINTTNNKAITTNNNSSRIPPQEWSNAAKCLTVDFPQGEKSRVMARHFNQSQAKIICLRAMIIKWVASQA